MAVVVLDLTDGQRRLDLVLDDWGRAGLIQTLIWMRSADGTMVHRVVAPQSERIPTERNAAINLLGDHLDVRLVVLVPSAAAEWTHLGQELDAVTADLDQDFGFERPVPRCLFILPWSPEGDGTISVRDSGLLRRPWDDVYLVAAEDSERPGHGLVYGDREAAVAAHTLVAIGGLWMAGPFAQERLGAGEPHAGSARVVRAWSRVVDAGHLVDHVALHLADVAFDSDQPKSTLLDASTSQLRQLPAFSALIDRSDAPTTPPEPKTGWAYLVALLKHLVRNAPRSLWRTLRELIVDPVVARARKAIDWLAQKLGAPSRSSGAASTGTGIDPLHALIAQLDTALDQLSSGGEVDQHPPGDPLLWDELGNELMRLVDDGRITTKEIFGAKSDEPMPVVARLAGLLDDEIIRAQDEYRALKTVAEEHARGDRTGAGPAPQDADEEMQGTRPSLVRRLLRWSKRLLLASVFAFGLLSLALGQVIPGVVLLASAGWFLLGGTLLALLGVAFWRCVREFAAANRRGWTADALETALRYWVSRSVRLTYRRTQLSRWSRTWASFVHAIASGPPIPQTDQQDFRPSAIPRSLRLATGLLDDLDVERLTRSVRLGEHGKTLYLDSWRRFIQGHEDSLIDPTIAGARRATTRMNIDVSRGLSDGVRGVARSAVIAALLREPAGSLISSVVGWQELVDERGTPFVEPPDGVRALGPSGRAVDESITDEELEIAGTRLLEATVVVDDRVTITVGADHPCVLGVGLDSSGIRLTVFDTAPASAGLRLAGLGAVRPGRPVLLVGRDESGTMSWSRSTIQHITHDGDVMVGGRPRVGTPVLDVGTAALVGIVVDDEGLAAGPVKLRACIDTDSNGRVASARDLDPGLSVPLDVSLTSRRPEPEPTATRLDVEHPDAATLDSFLGGISGPGADRFSSRTTLVPAHRLGVGQRIEQASASVYLIRNERLVLSAHRLELSEPFPVEEIGFGFGANRIESHLNPEIS